MDEDRRYNPGAGDRDLGGSDAGRPDRVGYEPLGNPRMGESTLPVDGEASHPGYVSFARPIGAGHAFSPPIVRGMIAATIGVLALSWLPFLGAFIAGFIGGWIARGWRGGLLATYLPGFLASILFAIGYWIAPNAIVIPIDRAAPWLSPWLITGSILVTIAGGMIGGYAHALREHAPKGSERRVQMD